VSTLVVVTLFLFQPVKILSSTILVERDGSGDFERIQPAVNAAASGDTIVVGSGRYDEWEMYGGNFQYPARCIVENKDLVILGDNEGTTIIGPSEHNGFSDQHHGIVLISNSSLEIKRVQFENLHGGVMSWAAGNVRVEDCVFTGNLHGAFLDRGSSNFDGCDISSSAGSLHVYSYFQESFTIKNTTVRQTGNTELSTQGVVIAACGSSTVDNCTIEGTRVGLQVDWGAAVYAINCRIDGIMKTGVSIGTGGCSVHLVGCEISNTPYGIKSEYENSNLVVESTVFSDIEKATFQAARIEGGYFRDCVLDKGSQGVVFYPWIPDDTTLETVVEYDMKENFWGTANPDSIQAWIMDSGDYPQIPYRILWEPFNNEPLSENKQSLGSFKAMFRK